VASGIPTVSVPGVSNWRPAIEVLKALGTKKVRLAFDADARSKPTVAAPLKACALMLVAEGFAVELETWPIDAGKGIDDLLAAGGVPTLLTGDAVKEAILEIARVAGVPDDRAEQSGDFARLSAVLN